VRHEKNHLQTFADVVDLSSVNPGERVNRTRREIEQKATVIYQGSFTAQAKLDGTDYIIVGQPDFLIWQGQGYVIRDSKISRRITKKDHPEILHQLNLYGWLYEKTVGCAPVRLEVHNGMGDLVAVEYDGAASALGVLNEIVRYRNVAEHFYSPVGWSKCTGCAYHPLCWPEAERRGDVAIIPEVDQGLARTLTDSGVGTIKELLAKYDADSLAGVERPYGKRRQKVGKKAERILLNARAIHSSEEMILERPQIPEHDNYVMFDLEGIPPYLDELDKIYLWGTQVFGRDPGEFHGAFAGFGADGDRDGWNRFLDRSQTIFEKYGDIPFVHWHVYEKTNVRKYIERYGDSDGVAERVLNNLLDLHSVTTQSLVLPLPSYSLKAVEKYVGFKRQLEEGRGDWAIAKFIEATEAEDPELRERIVNDLLEYNREDLQATWTVFQWLKSKTA